MPLFSLPLCVSNQPSHRPSALHRSRSSVPILSQTPLPTPQANQVWHTQRMQRHVQQRRSSHRNAVHHSTRCRWRCNAAMEDTIIGENGPGSRLTVNRPWAKDLRSILWLMAPVVYSYDHDACESTQPRRGQSSNASSPEVLSDGAANSLNRERRRTTQSDSTEE